MSDRADLPLPGAATTAGGLLRQARQAQGLHIAALAAAIKVTQRKLESLEADRFDELPDATFTRALAQAVCRTLKVDAAPVLALMPPPNGQQRLEQVAEGLNMPFRERPGRLVPREWAQLSTPTLAITALVLLAAAVVYLMPAGWSPLAGWMPSKLAASASAPVAAERPAPPASSTVSEATPANDAASMPMADALPAVQDTPDSTVATTTPVAAASTPGALPVDNAVQFRANAETWIEVVDARGKLLTSRTLQAGESVGLDGVMPMKVKIGNVKATEMMVRGQPTSLVPYTRDNIARFELK